MDKRELDTFENDETWDFDEAMVHPTSKTARAVVPVAFGSGEFERVAAYAREQSVPLSEFIRRAALDRVPTDYVGTHPDATEVNH